VIPLSLPPTRRAGVGIDLQPLEFSLLEYLMRNAGQVVSKTMIMEHVWDYNFNPQTNVVEARICYLPQVYHDRRQNQKKSGLFDDCAHITC
jgi:DNA-binding response OmpR family regulator